MKLLGNRVLLEPMPDEQLASSGSGIIIPNHFQKTNIKFRVLAVGPGEWVQRKKKRVFLRPEVEVGDIVLSRHWLDEGRRPPVYLDREDQKSRVIVDAEGLMASWRE